MDNINEKDVNIEIGNISRILDGKINEISLNEADDENGNQYIQLKNSDTINNTKGAETEIQNDEILFKKLNESENTTANEIDDTIDQENKGNINKQNLQLGKDNSDRFSNDQSERDFFEKIIVRNEEPFEELTSENYSITKCNNITTVKFEGNIFSYMTNPDNTEDFYFIKLNKKKVFELADLEEYKKNHLDFTRIPYNQLKNFVSEMNFIIQDLNKGIENKKFSIRMWNILKFFITVVILLVLGLLLFFNGEKLFQISANANKNITFGYIVLVILILAFFIYSFTQDLHLNYEICKIHLEKQEDLEKVIYTWNYDYFNSNLNMNLMIPITYPYIMITLQPNKRLYLENHEIYD